MAEGNSALGYCVKCRALREIADPVEQVMKNGALAIKGACRECSTKVLKFVKRGGG